VIQRLVICETLCLQVAAEARAAFPLECCGLIEGTRSGVRAEALTLHPSTNQVTAPDRFAIDPQLQFALLRCLRGSGRSVIGCYHSHPNGRPEPSKRDLVSAFEVDFLWLILAFDGAHSHAQLGAFVREPEDFAPVTIERRLLDRAAPPPV
jgi:proteasome lid subunit RPN8/RPN11